MPLRPCLAAFSLAVLLAACRPALPPPGSRATPPPGPSCTASPGSRPAGPVALYPGQGSEAVARPLGTTAAAMGYFERLPTRYAAEPQRRFPLVVFLHGAQERGFNLALLDGSAAAGGPQPAVTDLIAPERGGDTPLIVLYPQRCTYVLPPQELEAFLDHALAAYRVDPSRVYLVGHSAGAAQIWRALPALAPRVAAVVAVSGFDLGTDLCPARDVPVWAIHGVRDGVVPPGHTEDVVRRLAACQGRQPPRMTLLADGGHAIDREVLTDGVAGDDVMRWLLAHRLPAAAAAALTPPSGAARTGWGPAAPGGG